MGHGRRGGRSVSEGRGRGGERWERFLGRRVRGLIVAIDGLKRGHDLAGIHGWAERDRLGLGQDWAGACRGRGTDERLGDGAKEEDTTGKGGGHAARLHFANLRGGRKRHGLSKFPSSFKTLREVVKTSPKTSRSEASTTNRNRVPAQQGAFCRGQAVHPRWWFCVLIFGGKGLIGGART